MPLPAVAALSLAVYWSLSSEEGQQVLEYPPITDPGVETYSESRPGRQAVLYALSLGMHCNISLAQKFKVKRQVEKAFPRALNNKDFRRLFNDAPPLDVLDEPFWDSFTDFCRRNKIPEMYGWNVDDFNALSWMSMTRQIARHFRTTPHDARARRWVQGLEDKPKLDVNFTVAQLMKIVLRWFMDVQSMGEFENQGNPMRKGLPGMVDEHYNVLPPTKFERDLYSWLFNNSMIVEVPPNQCQLLSCPELWPKEYIDPFHKRVILID